MRPDITYQPGTTPPTPHTPTVPRIQIDAAASSASSPGRRGRSLRARWETTAGQDQDSFVLDGTAHRLLRFTPGQGITEPIERQHMWAMLPTQTGHAPALVESTARAGFLTHVVWTDDAGEIFGTWCPTKFLAPLTTPNA